MYFKREKNVQTVETLGIYCPKCSNFRCSLFRKTQRCELRQISIASLECVPRLQPSICEYNDREIIRKFSSKSIINYFSTMKEHYYKPNWFQGN